MKLQGIYIPVTIPFDHNGDLYKIKVQHNVEKWNRAAVAGYVVCGDEGRYLSPEEKICAWEWVASHCAPDKILIAATGQPSVRETVELTNRAESLGYKAAVVRTPDGPAAMQAIYFRAVADRVKLPVIVDGEMPGELDAHPNIVANVGGAGTGVPRLSGSAASIAEDFAAGAVGAVVSFANAAPYGAISIWEAHRTRDVEAALDWQRRIAPAVALVTAKYGIPGLKYAMDLNGYYGGPPRLPLVVVSPGGRREIEQAFEGIRG